MKIVQITPGAGKMFCGACFRDYALVKALRQLGHSVLMVPLYLPATLEDEQEADSPIFFTGINVYLEQKFPWFRHAPKWLHRILASRHLLDLAAGAAGKTRPDKLGEMTVSMLQGDSGNQGREFEDLISWLKAEKPDVVCLSNALLMGLARRIKSEVGVPVVCSLQGEDSFFDQLPAPHNSAAWNVARERAADIDRFIAPSQYYADVMQRRLNLEPGHACVVYNGIDPAGYASEVPQSNTRCVGFFARMCHDKGLDTLVDAFIELKKRPRLKKLKLRVGGYCGPLDRPFVKRLRKRLRQNRVHSDVEFCPNLDRDAKVRFLQSLTVFSVPATYSEAFGLYVVEAMAAGVPVVQPAVSAFPELIQTTGGGVLCKPNDPEALADEIEELVLHSGRARALGEAGRKGVNECFTAQKMAEGIARVYSSVLPARAFRQ